MPTLWVGDRVFLSRCGSFCSHCITCVCMRMSLAFPSVRLLYVHPSACSSSCGIGLFCTTTGCTLPKDCVGNSVSSVEDPEKMLEQTVNEMQSDLIKMRQASAQARPRTLSLCYISYLLGCSCARRQSVDSCANLH